MSPLYFNRRLLWFSTFPFNQFWIIHSIINPVLNWPCFILFCRISPLLIHSSCPDRRRVSRLPLWPQPPLQSCVPPPDLRGHWPPHQLPHIKGKRALELTGRRLVYSRERMERIRTSFQTGVHWWVPATKSSWRRGQPVGVDRYWWGWWINEETTVPIRFGHGGSTPTPSCWTS